MNRISSTARGFTEALGLETSIACKQIDNSSKKFVLVCFICQYVKNCQTYFLLQTKNFISYTILCNYLTQIRQHRVLQGFLHKEKENKAKTKRRRRN